MPKFDIFDRLHFYDFYTIKSLSVGNFGIKMLSTCFSFWGARHHLNFYAHAEHTHKFLKRILTAQCTHQFFMCMLRSFKDLCSVHAQVPDVYAQCTNQFLMRMGGGGGGGSPLAHFKKPGNKFRT